MINNKKAQSTGLAVILGIVFLIIGFASLNIIAPEIDRVRDSTALDCSNDSGISDATKLTCLAVDVVIPYLIIIVLSVILAVITAKLLS